MADGLERVGLKFGEVLYEPDTAFRHVYFPVDSLVSLIAVVKGGGEEGLEVGLVGRDGMVGISLALGSLTTPVRALVQGGGRALRMSAPRFVRELKRDPRLRRLIDRFAYVSMATAMQIAACNRAHLLEARMARWLLMMRDRLERDEFPLTQEFLATMLGVRRAGVTEAASALQERDLIRYSRGKVTLLEPQALRAVACGCYAMIRDLERGAR